MNWGEVDEREQIGCEFATCASPSARKPRAACTLDAQGARGQRATCSSEVILIPPSEAASMPVVQLLASQRGWGEARSRAFLAQVPCERTSRSGRLPSASAGPSHRS